jgi:hypothetical protein
LHQELENDFTFYDIICPCMRDGCPRHTIFRQAEYANKCCIPWLLAFIWAMVDMWLLLTAHLVFQTIKTAVLVSCSVIQSTW